MLVRYQGRPLPVHTGDVPIDRDPARGSCPLVVARGWLTLDVEGGHFEYRADERNACSGTPVGRRRAEGVLRQQGRVLRFGIPRKAVVRGVDPPWVEPMPADTLWYGGTWSGRTATVNEYGTLLEFRRRGRGGA